MGRRNRDVRVMDEERRRNIDARAASRLDEVERLCEERDDPTRPPTRIVQELAYPIQHMGEWIWSLTWRYPRIGDLKAIQHLDEDKEGIEIAEVLVHRLTPLVNDDSVAQLSGCDMVEAGRIVRGFLHRRLSLDSGESS